jgi:excisionase family DNA binding protein
LDEKKLLTVREAAAYIGLSKSTLDKMRCANTGPIFIRPGRRRVMYAVGDLDLYLTARRQETVVAA